VVLVVQVAVVLALKTQTHRLLLVQPINLNKQALQET
jgi:hypothetical protein